MNMSRTFLMAELVTISARSFIRLLGIDEFVHELSAAAFALFEPGLRDPLYSG